MFNVLRKFFALGLLSFCSECLGEDVLKTDKGIEKKIIVVKDGGSSLYEKPDGAVIKPLPEMTIAFILNPSTGNIGAVNGDSTTVSFNGKDWYVVSFDAKSSSGYIPKSDVAEWTTRSLLKPLSNPNRPFFVYQGGTLDKPELAPEKAISYTGLPVKNYEFMVPLLAPSPCENCYFPCVVFGGNFASTSDTPEKAPATTDEFVTVDIVFTIDTTASMAPMIEAVKEVVSRIASALVGKNVEGRDMVDLVNFGLVEYQDSTPGLSPSKVSIPLTQAPDFLKKISTVQVSSIGSEEWKEDVIAGLLAALDRNGDVFGKSVGWRSNSSKHIFLCGDASAHLPGTAKSSTGKDYDYVITLANGKSGTEREKLINTVFMNAIFAKHPDGEGDWATCKQEFQKLTEMNTLVYSGLFETLENSPSSKEKIVDTVSKDLRSVLETIRTSKASQSAMQSNSRVKVTQYLINGLPFKGVKTGFVRANNVDDQQVAVETFFVSKSEMQLLKATIDYIFANLDKFSFEELKSSDAALTELQAAFAKTASGKKLGRDLESKDKLSKFIEGLPFRTPIFEKSLDDLKSMNQRELDTWKRDIQSCSSGVEALLKKDDWRVLMKDAKEQFNFFPASEMP